MIDLIKNKSTFVEIISIVIISVVMAFVYNYFSVKGISLVKTSEKLKVASDSDLFSQIYSDTGSNVIVTTDQMKHLVKTGNALIIDARNPEAYINGHIPTAINIPFLEVFNYVETLHPIPRDTLMIIYCEGVHCELSKNLSQFLKGMNFTRIYLYDDGIEVWNAQNLPLEVKQ